MNIAQELSIVRDNIAEYGMTNITQLEYDAIYQQGRAEAVEQFREYLKTVIPCEMPQDVWDMGVDNTCDRMLKEQTE